MYQFEILLLSIEGLRTTQRSGDLLSLCCAYGFLYARTLVNLCICAMEKQEEAPMNFLDWIAIGGGGLIALHSAYILLFG